MPVFFEASRDKKERERERAYQLEGMALHLRLPRALSPLPPLHHLISCSAKHRQRDWLLSQQQQQSSRQRRAGEDKYEATTEEVGQALAATSLIPFTSKAKTFFDTVFKTAEPKIK